MVFFSQCYINMVNFKKWCPLFICEATKLLNMQHWPALYLYVCAHRWMFFSWLDRSLIIRKFKVKPQCYITTHLLKWLFFFFFTNNNTKVLENSLTFSYEAKDILTIGLNNPTARWLPERNENIYTNTCI